MIVFFRLPTHSPTLSGKFFGEIKILAESAIYGMLGSKELRLKKIPLVHL